jgi:hypothetical protein
MKTLILALSLVSMNAFAWGPTGHRAVALIAERYLDASAELKIYEILGNQTLAKVSNWSDEIKSEPDLYSHTFNWHYTDWKDEDHAHDETNSSGKLLTAISEQVEVLKNPKSSREEKSFALKFIVHLVGDLHQPLHVGNGLDQGGNKCRVSFHNRQTNLHALWDEGMIEFTKLSYTEFAVFAIQGKSPEQIRAWSEGDVVDWALESKVLRSQIYPEDVGPSAAPMSVKEYCRSDIKVPAQAIPKLSYEYSYKFIPVVEERIFQAGLRLAKVLNAALK